MCTPQTVLTGWADGMQVRQEAAGDAISASEGVHASIFSASASEGAHAASGAAPSSEGLRVASVSASSEGGQFSITIASASEGVHVSASEGVHAELPAGSAPAEPAGSAPLPAGTANAVARWELAIEHALFTRLYFSRTPWEEALFDRYSPATRREPKPGYATCSKFHQG